MTDFENFSLNKLTQFIRSSSNSVLIRAASSAIIIRVIGQGLSFGIQILLARVLGPENYGVYTYVLAWINMLVLLANLGMDIALLRYIAAYRVEKKWDEFRGILLFSIFSTFLVSIIIGGLGSAVVYILKNKIGVELSYAFIMAWFLLPLLALDTLRQSVARSLKNISKAYVPDMIGRPLLLASFVIFWLSAGFARSMNAYIAIAALVVSTKVSFLLGSYWLYGSLPESVKSAKSRYSSREWLIVALPLFFVSATYVVINQTDTLMIGAFLGTTQAGIYATASKIASLIGFGLIGVNVIAAPMISEFYTQGRLDELQRFITISARGVFVITLFIGVIVIIAGPKLLSLFGESFTSGYRSLVILTVGQLVNAFAGSVGFLMTMTGLQKEASLVTGFSALLNILLNLLLVPYFGSSGAAISTILTISLWNITLSILVKKRLGINAMAFSFVRGRK